MIAPFNGCILPHDCEEIVYNLYYTYKFFPSQEKNQELPHSFGATPRILLLTEGHAVSALIHGRVCLMGAYQDLVQGAVVLLVTVMGALLDSALDALVGIAVHNRFLLFCKYGTSMRGKEGIMQNQGFPIDIFLPTLYNGCGNLCLVTVIPKAAQPSFRKERKNCHDL